MREKRIQEKDKINLQLFTRKKSKEKGITLIALVVSIIILLILAGVSIATISGENGIIKKAMEAKERTQIAEEKERLDLELTSMMFENGGKMPTIEEYLKYLIEKEIITEDDVVRNEDGSVNIVTDKGIDVTLKETENGEIGVEVVLR